MKKTTLKKASLFFCILITGNVTAQNTPPVVKAGSDQLIALSDSAFLSGSASDDGLPGPMKFTWSLESGPGTVSFSNASVLKPKALFSAPGNYYLRLTANDGALARYDDVRVTVKANAAERKCNPGNYVAFVGAFPQTEVVNAASLPGVAGIQIRYDWAVLEPAKDVYDFSSIQADLNALSTLGKQLVAMVETKSFTPNVSVTPAYLSAYTADWGPNANGGGGVSIALWKPEVITRMKLLLDTLAKKFDSHPNLEGIATQETALGQPWTPTMQSFGYTPEIYRDAMINILAGASNSFKQSGIFWYMNFMPGSFPFKESYLKDVARAVAPLGAIRAGGPDVLPDDNGLQNRTYPQYDSLVGELPLFCSIQNDSYRHLHEDTVNYSTKYWTLQEMVNFSRKDLHVNYLFWNYKKWKTAGQPDEYNFDDAKPVMAVNPSHNPQLINPSPAGAISGLKTVCRGQTKVSYSVPAINSATGYIWSYSGTGAAISGSSNSITINFSSLATSGSLTVMGSNCCGTGKISAAYAITVNPVPATPAITQNSNVLTSSATTGNQWYRNGTLISGATGSTYTVTANGIYTVIVTLNGCSSSPSSPVTIISTEIPEAEIAGVISVSPNPSTAFFLLKVSYKIELKEVVMKIYDLCGKEVKSINIQNHETIIHRDDLKNGIYFYCIIKDNATIAKGKLIFQEKTN